MTTAYDDKGSGPALVLIHGHPFDRSMWRPQLDHFGDRGWRVVAPDLRGYGKHAADGEKTPLETFAKDITGLLDQLGTDRFVLAGLSMGGQIAMEVHRLFPERIRALILADTSPRAETAEGRRNRTEMAKRLLREGLRPYADEVLTKMVSPATVKALPEVAEHVHRMMRTTSPQGAAAALRGRAERPDYVPMLPEIRVPALVVVGDQDEYTPIAEAEFTHSLIPDAELVIVEGAAHLPNLERPDDFNAALAKFLDGLG